MNLTNQSNYASQIQSKIQTLKEQMDLRLPIWNRLSYEKKKTWILNGNDPLMTLAWNIYKYLRDNFFGEVDDG